MCVVVKCFFTDCMGRRPRAIEFRAGNEALKLDGMISGAFFLEKCLLSKYESFWLDRTTDVFLCKLDFGPTGAMVRLIKNWQ